MLWPLLKRNPKTVDGTDISILWSNYKGYNMNKPEQPAPSKFQQPGRTGVIKGSILAPHNAGLRFVLSITNLAGKPDGNPLYPTFEKKWVKVRQEARGWYATKTGAYKLGAINTTAVQSDTWVIHLLAQDEEQKTDAAALEKCLKEVCKMAKYERASVHVSSLLTDAVPELTDLVRTQLLEQGVSVYFYEEPAA